MAQPFVGEIRMFAGTFAPGGWRFCSGQLLPISGNDALFALIGTTYGGDGQFTFALPDLRGRVPLHSGSAAGQTYLVGQSGGAESVTLTVNQLPSHRHAFASTAAATRDTPAGNVLGSPGNAALLYASGAIDGAINPAANPPVGGSQAHANLMPYLCTSFIISLFGIFPSPS